jgi:anhydro-N-acetylmuramic acid kinase
MAGFSNMEVGSKVIGLMSGTSLDGIDAALLDTDGVDIVRPGPSLTVPYDGATRAQLRAALDTALGMAQGAPVPQSIADAERVLTQAHAQAVTALLDKAGLKASDIDLIGFHGQTILHRPEKGWTWQIGDGSLLAKLTGIDVVNDFRSADVAGGGQGAPLMPLYHAALVRLRSASPFDAKHLEGGGGCSIACDAKAGGGVVIVNVGGVAQVTYMDGDTVLAFDTGPGNAPIDDWMQRHSGNPVDTNGTFARSGMVNEAVLIKMLGNPFFARIPPKSLDRMDFGMEAVEALSPADGAATLTAFTAASIARAGEHFAKPAATWIVTGGGRHNAFLMEQLNARVNAPVLKAEDAGWDGDTMEAEGFAYLAVRSKEGLPLSLPTTTGVKEAMTGGQYWKA